MRWCTYCQRASEVVVVLGGFYLLEEPCTFALDIGECACEVM